jgi:lipoprotein NlpD
VIETPSGASTAAAPAVAVLPREGFYVVKKGDTLYRVALDHGLDYKELAAWNNIENASKLEVGQQLRIMPPEGLAVVKPVVAPAVVTMAVETPRAVGHNTDTLKREPKGGAVPYSEQALAQVRAMEGGAAIAKSDPPKPADRPAEKPAVASVPAVVGGDDVVDWTWPAAGKVLAQFAEGGAGKEANKGLDISGRMGEPIQAAAAGKVTYVGSLRGYGDFLVVRHKGDFISVYAHTSKILVKKDQVVGKGQKIAEIGSSDADQPKLHFEIRQQGGKPIDPLKYLPVR